MLILLLLTVLMTPQPSPTRFNCVVTDKDRVTCLTIEPVEHKRGVVEFGVKWENYPDWWLVSDGPKRPLRKVKPVPGQLLKAELDKNHKLVPLASCEVRKQRGEQPTDCGAPSRYVKMLMEASKGK